MGRTSAGDVRGRRRPARSSPTLSASVNRPLRSRRSAARCAPTPSRDAEVVGQRAHVEPRRTGRPAPRRGLPRSRPASARSPRPRPARGPPAGRGAPGRRPGARPPSWPTPPEASAAAGPGIGPAPPRPSAGSSVTAAPGRPARRRRRSCWSPGRTESSPGRSCRSTARNCASRVARPSSSGSTPVASGSSVPVWPMRGWPRARRATRHDVVAGRAGGLVDDQPAFRRAGRAPRGRLMPRTRLVGLLRQAGRNGRTDARRPRLVAPRRTCRHGAAGGVLVPAAAELLGHGRHVDRALGAQAHADTRPGPSSLKNADARISRTVSGRLISPSVSS